MKALVAEGSSRRLTPPSRLRWRSKGTLAMAALLLLYGLLSVKRSEAKPLWFDELGTLNVAAQPTLAQMFRVEPADGNPPLQYLLARPCLHVFGVNALALRLPAMCFVGLALVCVYLFVGRRFGAAAGLVVPALLLVSRLSDYGVEARPYGLLIGLLALLLVFWQRAAETDERRTGALIGVAVTVFALVIAQPMGFLWAGVPLLSAEAYRWWRSRHADRSMLLAILIGFCGFAITIYFGRETQAMLSADAGHSHSSIALPTLGKFLEALQVQGLPPALLLLAMLGGLAFWLRRTSARRGENAGLGGAPPHEWIAVVGLALAIFPAYLFTRLVTHYFWARYLVPGIFGSFVLLGMACGLVGGYLGRKRTAAAVLIAGLCLIFAERRSMVATTAAASGSQDSVLPTLLTGAYVANSGEPIVIAKPFFFPEIWWYSPSAMRQRLHYIADAPQASQTSDFVPELTLLAMHQAGSALFPPDGLAPFLAEHHRFLLWHHEVVQGCWLEDFLHAQHYSFTPVVSDASGNETLYEVAAPAAVP